jgi:hypothetical protein
MHREVFCKVALIKAGQRYFQAVRYDSCALLFIISEKIKYAESSWEMQSKMMTKSGSLLLEEMKTYPSLVFLVSHVRKPHSQKKNTSRDVCKGWAIKPAPAPRSSTIYCAKAEMYLNLLNFNFCKFHIKTISY